MRSKILLLSLGSFLLVQLHAENKPNILWIITDDQRADSLQCFNRATTGKDDSTLAYVMSANVDALAKDGTLFTSAFCTSPMCTPSRGSMQMGRCFARDNTAGEQRTRGPTLSDPPYHKHYARTAMVRLSLGKRVSTDSHRLTHRGKIDLDRATGW